MSSQIARSIDRRIAIQEECFVRNSKLELPITTAGGRRQSTKPSTTRPSNCRSPLRKEDDKAQDRRRLVLQIADHRCGTFDDSSSRLPITTAGGGIKAQDRPRHALRIANHHYGRKATKHKTVDDSSSRLPITTAGGRQLSKRTSTICP